MNRPFAPATGKPRGPEHYWQQIKDLAEGFTIRDILDRSNGITRAAIRLYVLGLIELGYVEAIGQRETGSPTRLRATVYRCIRTAVIAPVVRDPSATGHHGQDAQQIWNAMRVLPQFSVSELAVAASTDERIVKRHRANEFIMGLKRAGLVRVVQPKRGRQNGSTPAIFALVKAANTGPRPPRINKQRGGVFDPNRRRWISNRDRAEVSA